MCHAPSKRGGGLRPQSSPRHPGAGSGIPLPAARGRDLPPAKLMQMAEAWTTESGASLNPPGVSYSPASGTVLCPSDRWLIR